MRRSVLFGITLLVGLAATGLGVWQLRRLETRKSLNREARAARTLAPFSLNAPGARALSNRRVFLSGTYDEAHEFLLRGRVVQGVPAVQVVTPIRLEGRDTAFLVNRGYVPAPDATNPGTTSWSEPGPVEVRGVLLPVPDRSDGAPIMDRGRETWKALDLTAMRGRVPYPVAPFYIVAAADSSSAEHTVRGRQYPIRAEPPPLDNGPHLSYAIQWFGIALAALAFGVFFVLRPSVPRSVA
jgi:surfeit locus 1 family protein